MLNNKQQNILVDGPSGMIRGKGAIKYMIFLKSLNWTKILFYVVFNFLGSLGKLIKFTDHFSKTLLSDHH
jgi:hypothetical protein